VLLAVAIAGAAVAIVLSRGGSSDARLAANTATAQTVTAPPVTTRATTGTPGVATTGMPTQTTTGAPAQATTQAAETPSTATSDNELPAVSGEQMQSEIQHMLLEWHEDVVHGNFYAAWELLSRRKQAQDSAEYGYPTWVKNQATLRPYLNPSGLQVAIEDAEPADGVAEVDVTGMGWDKPGASCSEWSGITWVKYEGGAWKYDPGYSTTPQREGEWKSRYPELLGGRC
jgi:hypothetical protein